MVFKRYGLVQKTGIWRKSLYNMLSLKYIGNENGLTTYEAEINSFIKFRRELSYKLNYDLKNEIGCPIPRNLNDIDLYIGFGWTDNFLFFGNAVKTTIRYNEDYQKYLPKMLSEFKNRYKSMPEKFKNRVMENRKKEDILMKEYEEFFNN